MTLGLVTTGPPTPDPTVQDPALTQAQQRSGRSGHPEGQGWARQVTNTSSVRYL